VLKVQLDNCTDEVLQNEQRLLNRDYDKFVKTYGIINSKLNRSLFREDADYALLISIEKVDEKTGTAEKTDVFSKRTIKPYQKVTHCNSVQDFIDAVSIEDRLR
jgi:helicase